MSRVGEDASKPPRASSHTHRIFILRQTLVVSTQGNQEQYCRHALETMDPLSPLALLPANVNHVQELSIDLEDGLGDASCS